MADVLSLITDVRRVTIQPGDALVLHMSVTAMTDEQGAEVKRKLRAALGLSADTPVLVLAKGVDLEVVEHGPG